MIEKTILAALCVPHGDPNDDTTIWGLPLVLWGTIGISKSATVETVGAFLGMKVATVFLSTCEPTDFGGVLSKEPGKPMTRECAMAEVRELCDLQEGILFIDEATTVGHAVQAALMGVVFNRRMGDIYFPPKVRVLLAANPPEIAVGGHDFSIPFANRCCHVSFPMPSVEDWISWNYDREVSRRELPDSLVDVEEQVKSNWAASEASAQALICGFLKSTGLSMLHNVPDEGHADRYRAFQTHRTWFFAQNAYATCKALKLGEDIAFKLMMGCVGEGAITEFAKWKTAADLPDPAEMLINGWTPDKRRLDRSFAAYSAMAGHVASLKDKKAKIDAAGQAYKLLKQACDAGLGDLMYRPTMQLVRGQVPPSSLPPGSGAKAGIDVLALFKDRAGALSAMHKAQGGP